MFNFQHFWSEFHISDNRFQCCGRSRKKSFYNEMKLFSLNICTRSCWRINQMWKREDKSFLMNIKILIFQSHSQLTWNSSTIFMFVAHSSPSSHLKDVFTLEACGPNHKLHGLFISIEEALIMRLISLVDRRAWKGFFVTSVN